MIQEYAVIENDTIVNVILADENFVSESNLRLEKLTKGGIGWTLHNGIFIPPQPFPSWILNEEGEWVAPKPEPSNGNYYWDESVQEWRDYETYA